MNKILRKFKVLFGVGITISVFTLLTGCGSRSITHKIEQAILPELPKAIGPADSYAVEVDGGLSGLMNSRLASLRITGRNVLFLGKYPVDELRVEMRNVRFDSETRSLESVESTSLRAAIYEASLLQYIAKEHPELKQTRLTISEGFIIARTRPELIGISAEVEAVGKLRVTEGRKVDFVPETLTMGGMSMPSAMRSIVESRLNPLIDLSNASIPINITRVEMVPGKVLIEGTVDLSRGLPRGQSSGLKVGSGKS